MNESFVGTAALVRLALRRDRVMAPVWAVALVGSAASSAAATVGLYPTVASRAAAAGAVNSTPALVALYGRVFDPTSLGAVAMFKLGGFGAAMTALLAVLLVVRHSRAEEESGRLELVGAAVVGRRAALAAAVLVATASVVTIGLLTALALVGSGLPASGSLALGLGWAGSGAAFVGVAAVAAQLAVTARGATGLAGAVLGAAYLLRAAGDGSASGRAAWLSWLSPVGWAQQLRPFAGERWWVLLLPGALAVAGAGAAFAVAARRDVGAGLLPERAGPARARPWLRSPLALAWRLQRAVLGAWTVGFVLLGAVIGAIASGIGSLLNSPQARDLITRLGGQRGLTDAFLAAELGFAAIAASVYGVQAVGRMASEESAGRAEPVLATAAGRLGWAAGHVSIALGGTALIMTGAGVAAGGLRGLHTRDPGDVAGVLAGAVVQIPAVWVVTAIAVAACGFSPRLGALGWAALAAFVLLGEVGPVLRLDHRVIDLSPFAQVPRLPGGTAAAAPLAWLVALSAGLVAAGLAALRRRDIG